MKKEIPSEYQKGSVKFLNCRIDLSKRTFIPRPETEFWVKKTIKEIKKQKTKNKKQKILDIFAGSGCIGVAILRACPELGRVACPEPRRRVDFVDIDKKAIEQIKINLNLNKISEERYRIFQADLFEGAGDDKYDYIFANPPYVAKNRSNEVQLSVLKYEPQKALWGGERGLLYIEKFLKEAKKHLKENGIIYFEFDPLQKEEITNILKREGYKKFRFFKDQFKKYRWTKVSLK